MLTVYSITYNESLFIQFMIDHYRSRFPNCHIIFYDNSSTDNTAEIAKKNNCEVRTYNSNNSLDDGLHMQIKNSCWKDAKTPWVLVSDLDELLDINEEQLKKEESFGTTLIKNEGWDMFNMEDNFDLHNIKYGTRNSLYDKKMLFNKNSIKEINYGAGCHDCRPIGHIQESRDIYKMYHYKYINLEFVIQRYKITATRLSENNKRNNWGHQALETEINLRAYLEKIKQSCIKIL